MGVLAATHRGRWQDQVIRFLSLLGYSMPVFWLGLVGLLLFYAKLGWVEGVELNFLGLVAGLDLRHPGIKLPGFGRIGIDDGTAVAAPSTK